MKALALPWRGRRRADSPLHRLMRHSAGRIGTIVVFLFVATACLAPLLAPYDPLATDWGALRQAPSAAHCQLSGVLRPKLHGDSLEMVL